MDSGKIDWRFSRRNQAEPDRIYSPIASERKPQLQGKSIFYRKREVTKMFEDKTLVCKECGKKFHVTKINIPSKNEAADIRVKFKKMIFKIKSVFM